MWMGGCAGEGAGGPTPRSQGLDLVRNMVSGVAGGLPSWAVLHPDGCLTEVLLSLFLLCKDPAMAVVTQAVDGLPDVVRGPPRRAVCES